MPRRRKPKCKKRRYDTGGQALEALEALKVQPGRDEQRFYRCGNCGGFHLTSWRKAA